MKVLKSADTIEIFLKALKQLEKDVYKGLNLVFKMFPDIDIKNVLLSWATRLWFAA